MHCVKHSIKEELVATDTCAHCMSGKKSTEHPWMCYWPKRIETSIWEYFEIGKYAGVQFSEILSHKLVAWGCTLFVGEMTNTLRAILPDPKPPLILSLPRFMIGCRICTCCTWVCLVSTERSAASLCLPRSRTRKSSTSSWSPSTPAAPINFTKHKYYEIFVSSHQFHITMSPNVW